MSKSKIVFERRGEWGGYEIRPGKLGWIVDRWSAVQGEITNRRRLVFYGGDFPAGVELDWKWNDGMTYGEALAAWSEGLPGKTIRAGFLVR